MDGWVIVGTKLDSKQLDKDLKNAERKLQQYERESEKLTKQKVKVEIDLQPYEEQKRLIKETTDEMLAKSQTEQQVKNVLEMEQMQLDDLNNKYSKQLENVSSIDKKIQNNVKNQELMKDQIDEMRKKSNGLNINFEDLKKMTKESIKNIAKWALAIFSVRGAYSAVRKAMSTLTQYNEKLANQLNTIQLMFASALEPLITRIVNLVYQLMSYVNVIAKAWFGIDLFASATEKAMSKSAKSAKDVKKSLAGFDEMNVLNDTGTASTSDSIGIEPLPEVEVPSWIQWIADNKELVIGAFVGIAGALVAVKLGLDAITGLGIGLILAGIVILIQGIVDFIKDPSWDAFWTILQGIALVVAGIAVLMGGWIVALVALGVAIVTYIIKNWDKVKEILGKVGTWIYDKIIKPVADFFVGLWDGIVNGVKTAVNFVKNIFSSIVDFFKNIINKIVGLFKTIGTKVGDAIGGAFKAVINGILKAIETILNNPIKMINKLIDVINKVPGINLGTLPTFNLPRLAVGGVVNMPGRGVNYMGANIGERGAEGVIPLTNTQMMEQLGQTIGRYITVNNHITTTLNGRVIGRELKRSENESNFAFNR
jgi:predicted  nucleic acid-binding Zn-ribbon protein